MTRAQEKRDRISATGRLRKILASLETWQRRWNEFDTDEQADGAIRELRRLLQRLDPDDDTVPLTGKGE